MKFTLSNKLGYNSFTIGIFLTLLLGILIFRDGIINILTWDIMGYNSYLPLIFEKHSFNVDLAYFKTINDIYNNSSTLYQYVDLPNGNVFIKYTMGWAIFYTPFYFIAELWASWGGYPNDGFSYPYQVMALLGSFVYFVLSIVLLRKVLLLFFNEKISATVMLIICLGSNFFIMNTMGMGTSHHLIFMTVCIFILMTHKFHTKPSIRNAVFLGISVGLIALTRTPSVVIALFAVFYNYKNYGPTIFHKLGYFLKHKFIFVLITVFAALMTFLPQILYWKITTGNFLINSYANNPGEGMDWFTPYIFNVLFSFKSGWLIYTPIMFFSLIGLFFWVKEDRSNGLAGTITFAIFLYIVSCWTSWWYASHFGHRAMLDIYPILAIGLGFFLKNYTKKWVFIPIILFVLLNLFQTYQYYKEIIRTDLMTKEAYWSLFLQTSPPTEDQRKLLAINPDEANNSILDISKFKLIYEDSLLFKGFVLSDKTIYAPGIELQLSKIKNVPNLLVQSEWRYEGTNQQLEGKIFNTHMKYGEIPYEWRGKQYNHEFIVHDTINKTVKNNYIAPNLRTKNDVLYTGLWAQYGDSIIINSLKVRVYEWKP